MIAPQDLRSLRASFASDVRRGLGAARKSIPPRWLYDAVGSALFEAITLLPEYYLTAAETEILDREADAFASSVPPGAEVVEFGSGSARKSARILEAMLHRSDDVAYRPIDISASALQQAGATLRAALPRVRYEPVVAEYGPGFRAAGLRARPRLVLFLGSSVGNFEPVEAVRFLAEVASHLGPEDRLLLGTDLVKDRATIERAYDDRSGVTAAFNRNLLGRINRELGGTFDPAAFAHVAFFDSARRRVEMHLASTRPHEVRVRALDATFAFEEGEAIHTENSYKFSDADVRRLLDGAGLVRERVAKDRGEAFALHLARAGPA